MLRLFSKINGYSFMRVAQETHLTTFDIYWAGSNSYLAMNGEQSAVVVI